MQNYLALLNNRYILIPLLLWSLVWKGLALWRAAKLDQKYWYIILLGINTMGVLEILYLYVFSRPRHK
ncbi:MAG TPA: DUF5652 family protein [Candidatus Paceibacterota bacterium]|nr:DUF5652 family protein [Candidatus Paceibacterota bacterium]